MASGFKNFERVMASLKKKEEIIRRTGFKSVERQANTIKARMRAATQAVFPRNRRAGGAIRSKIYGNAKSGNPAAIVYSKFGRWEGGKFIDYIAPRLFGATVLPDKSQYLRIPVTGKGVGLKRARQQLIALSQAGKLRVVPSGGVLLLIYDTRRRSTIVGILVKQVRYPRRTSLDALVHGGARAMVSAIKGGA